jgi:hypothetical protein
MFRIATVKVTTPSEIKVSRFDITKSQRAASGKMIMQIIATKRRVDVTWKMLKDSDLATIINTIAANKPFFVLEYPDVGGAQTMTCYAGDIVTSLWHTIGGIRYWEEVSIPFIEQ